MKFITKAEIEKLVPVTSRKTKSSLPFMVRNSFEVGQHLFISTREWHGIYKYAKSTHPIATANAAGEKMGRKFLCRQYTGGWVITRTK